MSLRDITIVRDERGDGGRMTSRTGSAQRFVRDLKKVKGVETRHWTKTIDFWSSQTRGELAPYGGRSRWGPDEEASIKRLCLSPYVETINSKVMKRFCT